MSHRGSTLPLQSPSDSRASRVREFLDPLTLIETSSFATRSHRLPSLKRRMRAILRRRDFLSMLFIALIVFIIYLYDTEKSSSHRSAVRGIIFTDRDWIELQSSVAMPKIAPANKGNGFIMAQWLSKERKLGWCNSALSLPHECQPTPPCILSLDSKVKMDTWDNPFTILSPIKSKAIECRSPSYPPLHDTPFNSPTSSHLPPLSPPLTMTAHD